MPVLTFGPLVTVDIPQTVRGLELSMVKQAVRNMDLDLFMGANLTVRSV